MSFVEYASRLEALWRERSPGLVVLEGIPSTQTAARTWARDHQKENTQLPDFDLLAWQQSGGRGRGGKTWSSPAGSGIYASLVRRLPASYTRGGLQILPLLVSVALCEALNRWLDGRCRIKWPNDLLVEERKLCGILIDLLPSNAGSHLVVVGFGVNVGAEVRVFDEPRATSLRSETDVSLEMAEVAHHLVQSVDAALARWPVGESLLEEYRRYSVHCVGDTMRCQVGSQMVEGSFLGFGTEGFLRLEVGGSERRIHAGELSDEPRGNNDATQDS